MTPAKQVVSPLETSRGPGLALLGTAALPWGDFSGGVALLPEHLALFTALDTGLVTGKPTLICGPSMGGKASAVIKWAHHRALRCEVRLLTPDVTAEDLFGS